MADFLIHHGKGDRIDNENADESANGRKRFFNIISRQDFHPDKVKNHCQTARQSLFLAGRNWFLHERSFAEPGFALIGSVRSVQTNTVHASLI